MQTDWSSSKSSLLLLHILPPHPVYSQSTDDDRPEGKPMLEGYWGEGNWTQIAKPVLWDSQLYEREIHATEKENKADMQKKNVATRDHAVKIISDRIIYGFYNVLYGPSKNQLFLFHFPLCVAKSSPWLVRFYFSGEIFLYLAGSLDLWLL